MKILKNYKFVIIFAFLVFLPVIVYGKTLGEFIQDGSKLLRDSVVGFIFTLAFVYFFWGVVQYMLNPENAEKREKGKEMAINGIIAITVMFSVYSLVRIVMNTFDLSEDEFVDLPNLPE